jgi:hypothetical protein
MTVTSLQFVNHGSLKGREDRYIVLRVDTAAVLKSWKGSLFSFEWLTPEGTLRGLDDLPLHERDKRLKIEKQIDRAETLERPVLGIGILDNVEIGAGRDVFLTLAARGIKHIEVHIPASAQAEFKSFLSR